MLQTTARLALNNPAPIERLIRVLFGKVLRADDRPAGEPASPR